ncbi:TetR family transcriptional regulator [Streptomyces decoyicus]|uniref:TetR family transcriptional regulator n=1 Tax=Streptomyces decoyicus TaxID=249567 RepID=UPI00345D8920
MVKQERALRTRRALVAAAATEFDRDGYEGTSLSRISRAAGISMGALTFHFQAKSELAEAVEEAGQSVTRAALDKVTATADPPLHQVAALMTEVILLVEKSPEVRAAVRLERERPGRTGWTALWLPVAHLLLRHAHGNGQLRAEARPDDVTTLVRHLVAGAVTHLRHGDTAATDDFASLLSRNWQLVLAGIATSEAGAAVRGRAPSLP